MTVHDEDSVSRLIQRLLRMGRQLYRSLGPGELTPAQRAALRCFSAASRFSRTVAGFADYQVTTKSSASEIISELVRRGLVTRTPWPEDRRRVRIDLTEEGRKRLAGDPVLEAAEAVHELPDSLRERLLPPLENLAAEVGRRTDVSLFGDCRRCAHGERDAGDGRGFHCACYDASLDEEEADRMCATFEPAG